MNLEITVGPLKVTLELPTGLRFKRRLWALWVHLWWSPSDRKVERAWRRLEDGLRRP